VLWALVVLLVILAFLGWPLLHSAWTLLLLLVVVALVVMIARADRGV
jgi:isoprenylcysteine carboxyl methyltransferase (ICMT) family protein YpbQ